MSVFLR